MNKNFENDIDKLTDKLDELIEGNSDFIYTEGNDVLYGYVRKIYQYSLEMGEYQKRVFSWLPIHKTLYWIAAAYEYDFKQIRKN